MEKEYIDVKLEYDWEVTPELEEALLTVLRKHACHYEVVRLENNGDHWLHVILKKRMSTPLPDHVYEKSRFHIVAIAVGFLEAHHIPCA